MTDTETPSTNGLSSESVGMAEYSNIKRRNLGRKARKRRKKIQAIESAAAAAAASGAVSSSNGTINPTTTTTKTTTSSEYDVLPQDRSYVWPAVKDLCQLSDYDKQALIGQLGYLPGNAIQVTARLKDFFASHCSGDSGEEPLALQLYPLVFRHESDSTKSRRKRKHQQADATTSTSTLESKKKPLSEPFPTMFWVTHPRFRALISQLELSQEQDKGGGRVRQFQERLQKDSTAMESMKKAHLQYGQERFDLITPEDWKWIQDRKWEAAFAVTRGVAGIRNPAGIKCLHAHAAHYWSGCQENVVGQWVSQEVNQLLVKAKKEEG